jgi:hemolysin activation/secretion protein
MKRFVKISSILLLSSSFVVGEALAVVNLKTTSGAVVSSDRHNRSSIAKEIISERHRKKKEEGRDASKYLKKKLSKISCAQHKRISRIEIRGNKSIDSKEIRALVSSYLKGGITKEELNLISDKIEKHYRDEGYYLPIAHAKIKDSKLKINVVEGKIKNVIVVLDNEKRDKKILSNQRFLDLISQIEKATPIKTRDLERYLLLINKIHGYSVDYELEPLASVKDNEVANLVMAVKETQKGLASISVDNAGTSDLGKHQFTLASQIFNPIANDSLIINAGTSDKPKRFKMITAGYLKRLNSYGTSASIICVVFKR